MLQYWEQMILEIMEEEMDIYQLMLEEAINMDKHMVSNYT